MTAEGEVRPSRSAHAWEAVELPPDLRRGVEAAAKAEANSTIARIEDRAEIETGMCKIDCSLMS